MTDPDEITDAIVTAIAAIPAVQTHFTGGVSAYHDVAYTKSQWALAMQKAPSASILVIWAGTAVGRQDRSEMWRHVFSAFIRPPESYNGSTAFAWIVNGIPAGQDRRFIDYPVHPNCELMDVPTCSRKTDADGLDYFELVLAFRETGDY